MPLKYRTILIICLLAVGLCTIFLLPATREVFFAAGYWAESNPALAWPLYLIVFAFAVVTLLPAWMFMMAGGYLFGIPAGTALSLAAYLIGATISFMIARTIGHDWAQERISRNTRFRDFDRAARKNGFTAVLLARLALVFPYNLLNFACGLTSVRLPDYMLGTALGTLPILLVNVVIGAAATDLLTAMQEGTLEPDFTVLIGVATIACIILLFALIRYIRSRATASLPRDEE